MSDFNLRFSIPHGRTAQQAVDALKNLDQLVLTRCVVNSSGKIDIPGPGDIVIDDMQLTIEDGDLRIVVRGNSPFFVTSGMVRKGIETKLKRCLQNS